MATLAEQVSLIKIDDHYVSKHTPQPMGKSPLGFGGYTIALAIHAAYKSALDDFHLYSVLGHYLRATSTETPLTIKPPQVRQTKQFATYRVAIEQRVPSTNKVRLCMEVLAGFYKDKLPVLAQSPRPMLSSSHWQDSESEFRIVEKWFVVGRISETQFRTYNEMDRKFMRIVTGILDSSKVQVAEEYISSDFQQMSG